MKIKIGDLNFPFHKFQILMYKASLLWGSLTWVSQMIANKTNSYILISFKMSVATIFSYTIIYTLCTHLHLCPTLCNSTDCSLPGFSVHGILQARILASASEVAQSCPTLCGSMDFSLPGSSIHGIFQARVLEWVAISFSRGSS